LADRLFERVGFEVEFDDVVARRTFLSFVARKAFLVSWPTADTRTSTGSQGSASRPRGASRSAHKPPKSPPRGDASAATDAGRRGTVGTGMSAGTSVLSWKTNRTSLSSTHIRADDEFAVAFDDVMPSRERV
jgi:hypothetical protein